MEKQNPNQYLEKMNAKLKEKKLRTVALVWIDENGHGGRGFQTDRPGDLAIASTILQREAFKLFDNWPRMPAWEVETE